MTVAVNWSWQSQASNAKTGNIPTAYAGQSIDAMKATCSGCALLTGVPRESGKGVAKCYAWQGTPKLGFGSMSLAATDGESAYDMSGTDAVEPGGRYSLEYALENRHKSARYARLVALGDPARVVRKIFRDGVKRLRAASLGILGYTHFWRDKRNAGLKADLLASCNTISEADTAIAAGWIPAAVIDYDPGPEAKIVQTPRGAKLLICPAMRIKGMTCNACGMCDPQAQVWKAGKIDGIGFPDHSAGGVAGAKK